MKNTLLSVPFKVKNKSVSEKEDLALEGPRHLQHRVFKISTPRQRPAPDRSGHKEARAAGSTDPSAAFRGPHDE